MFNGIAMDKIFSNGTFIQECAVGRVHIFHDQLFQFPHSEVDNFDQD